jgi:hypothetical protein
MGSTAIIAAIDKELARLQSVRAVLLKRERAAKAGKNSRSANASKKKSKRQLTPEGRERIAAAQRKRWAAARRTKKR